MEASSPIKKLAAPSSRDQLKKWRQTIEVQIASMRARETNHLRIANEANTAAQTIASERQGLEHLLQSANLRK